MCHKAEVHLAHGVLLCFRKSVRFDRAAEFLAACASADTDEAQMMLKEARETQTATGEDAAEIINCSNADGITALHQVRRLLLLGSINSIS